MKMKVKETVLGVKAPERARDSANYDKNCPFTGGLSVKKELLKGKVIKKDISKSATIEWFRSKYVPKYERYEMRRSRLRVHNPPAINAQIGQEVLVARTRPISKTKHHVIIKIFEEIEDKKTSKKTTKKTEAKEN
jgi:small subunit ribosomal protein S17